MEFPLPVIFSVKHSTCYPDSYTMDNACPYILFSDHTCVPLHFKEFGLCVLRTANLCVSVGQSECRHTVCVSTRLAYLSIVCSLGWRHTVSQFTFNTCSTINTCTQWIVIGVDLVAILDSGCSVTLKVVSHNQTHSALLPFVFAQTKSRFKNWKWETSLGYGRQRCIETAHHYTKVHDGTENCSCMAPGLCGRFFSVCTARTCVVCTMCTHTEKTPPSSPHTIQYMQYACLTEPLHSDAYDVKCFIMQANSKTYPSL